MSTLKGKKEDKRFKHTYNDYPHKKKPTVLGIKKFVEELIEEEGAKHGLKFKPYAEQLLEKIALKLQKQKEKESKPSSESTPSNN